MTETEWLSSADPTPVLEYLAGRAGGRKWRLFACACCRRVAHLMPAARCREAISVAEAVADGEADPAAWELAATDVGLVLRATRNNTGYGAVRAVLAALSPAPTPADAVRLAVAAADVAGAAVEPSGRRLWAAERAAQADLVRDVFGDPFRPARLDPIWLTSTVATLARQMYASHDFAPMPILADALQDAGCDNEDVLAHCRSGGAHVRGCWVVDLLTGRK